jgi:hypothetical protein
MSGSNSLALVAGGLVVVALSFGAGMLGGSSASSDGGGDAAPAPRSVPDSVVRSRLDELDRRLTNVEERLRIVEDTADAALTRTHEIDALRRAVDALRAGGVTAPAETATVTEEVAPAPSGDDASGQMTADERDALEATQRDKLRKKARELVERHAPALMKQRLSRIADATAQGEADRRSQIYAESKQLAVLYHMSPAEEDTLREILVEESESSVREIAPYLGGGLERADYQAVKERFHAIWDHRDGRMAEILDEKELEAYQAERKEWRDVYDKVLDDMNAARLNR